MVHYEREHHLWSDSDQLNGSHYFYEYKFRAQCLDRLDNYMVERSRKWDLYLDKEQHRYIFLLKWNVIDHRLAVPSDYHHRLLQFDYQQSRHLVECLFILELKLSGLDCNDLCDIDSLRRPGKHNLNDDGLHHDHGHGNEHQNENDQRGDYNDQHQDKVHNNHGNHDCYDYHDLDHHHDFYIYGHRDRDVWSSMGTHPLVSPYAKDPEGALALNSWFGVEVRRFS